MLTAAISWRKWKVPDEARVMANARAFYDRLIHVQCRLVSFCRSLLRSIDTFSMYLLYEDIRLKIPRVRHRTKRRLNNADTEPSIDLRLINVFKKLQRLCPAFPMVCSQYRSVSAADEPRTLHLALAAEKSRCPHTVGRSSGGRCS